MTKRRIIFPVITITIVAIILIMAGILYGLAKSQTHKLCTAWMNGDFTALLDHPAGSVQLKDSNLPEGVTYVDAQAFNTFLAENFPERLAERSVSSKNTELLSLVVSSSKLSCSAAPLFSSEGDVTLTVEGPDMTSLMQILDLKDLSSTDVFLKKVFSRLSSHDYETQKVSVTMHIVKIGKAWYAVASQEVMDALHGGLLTYYTETLTNFYTEFYQLMGGAAHE